jgi:chromosome segregation ATPase
MGDHDAYFFKKIEKYDTILNDFTNLKPRIDKVELDSAKAVSIAEDLSKSIELHKTYFTETHKRISEESSNQEIRINNIKENLAVHIENVQKHLSQESSENSSLNKEMNRKIDCCSKIDDTIEIREKILKIIENVKFEIDKNKHLIERSQENLNSLGEKLDKLNQEMFEKHKDILRIKNSIISHKAEVSRKLKDLL